MHVGKRIKNIREKRNKTLLEVANVLGVTEATVQRYESGNIKNLKLDTIVKISEFLNVDPAYIMGWRSSPENIVSKSSYPYYPVSISAGSPIDTDAITENDVESISIPDVLMGKWAGSDGIYFTRANGDSMNKSIPHDSLMAVKQVELNELKDGDIVVYSDGVEFAVKRFYNDEQNGRLLFRPDSTDNSFIDHSVSYDSADSVRIHGKVVLHITELN